MSIQVLDVSTTEPTDAPSARRVLSWGGASDCAAYRVEEYRDSEWVARATVRNTGRPRYSFTTRPLEDVTTHQFRVVPIAPSGDEGTATQKNFVVVRTPDVPRVTYTYASATGKVTVATV